MEPIVGMVQSYNLVSKVRGLLVALAGICCYLTKVHMTIHSMSGYSPNWGSMGKKTFFLMWVVVVIVANGTHWCGDVATGHASGHCHGCCCGWGYHVVMVVAICVI